MLPGTALALILVKDPSSSILFHLALGIASTCLVASANYVLNEWLDRDFDRHHPTKKLRPSVRNDIRGHIVYLEYAVLASVGMIIAATLSQQFFLLSALLLIMGILYNVRPFRTKGFFGCPF